MSGHSYGGTTAAYALTHGKTFTAGVAGFANQLAPLLSAEDDRSTDDRALAVMSTMVGALMLSRTVDDAELSDRILAAALDSLTRGV